MPLIISDLATLFDAVCAPVLLLDQNGNILFRNKLAEQFLLKHNLDNTASVFSQLYDPITLSPQKKNKVEKKHHARIVVTREQSLSINSLHVRLFCFGRK